MVQQTGFFQVFYKTNIFDPEQKAVYLCVNLTFNCQTACRSLVFVYMSTLSYNRHLCYTFNHALVSPLVIVDRFAHTSTFTLFVNILNTINKTSRSLLYYPLFYADAFGVCSLSISYAHFTGQLKLIHVIFCFSCMVCFLESSMFKLGICLKYYQYIASNEF